MRRSMIKRRKMTKKKRSRRNRRRRRKRMKSRMRRKKRRDLWKLCASIHKQQTEELKTHKGGIMRTT